MENKIIVKRATSPKQFIFNIVFYGNDDPSNVCDRNICLSVRRRMCFIPTNVPTCAVVCIRYEINFQFIFAVLLVANFITVFVFFSHKL